MLLLTGLGSCSQEEFVTNGSIVEGEATTLQLQLQSPRMNIVTRGALNQAQEEEITSVAVFVFDAGGEILSSAMHASFAGQSLSVPTISGNDRKIYAIANYNKNHIDGLKSVTSEEDLRQLVVAVYGNPIYRELGMIKVGKIERQPLRPEGTTVSIRLEYVSAKITIKVINQCSDLWIESWALGGLPLKTYLLEREPDANHPNDHDAADFSNPNDYFAGFESVALPFDKLPAVDGYGSSTAPLTYESTFYTLENRRGIKGKADKTPIPNGWPHGDPSAVTSRKPYQEKAWEAPEQATFVRIMGRHQRDSNPKGMTINHYLGRNNTDDYNVCRATHYTYTLTIKSLTEIDIDTNIEQYDDLLPVRMAPDLLNLDGHATHRMFSVQSADVLSGQVDVEVLQSVGSVSGDWTDWVKLSLLPTYLHQVRAGADKPHIGRWQQAGAEGFYVRPKFIPHKSKRREGFSAPFAEFTFMDAPDSEPDLRGQNPDYPPYGNSYPNNDDVLPYLWAGRRMCNKITHLPTQPTQPSVQQASIYLYVDEYIPDGRPYREAVLRITHTVGGKATRQHWTLRQYAPILFLGLPGDNGSVMVVERQEEYAHLMQPLLPLDRQMTLGMQWGAYVGGTSSSDGYLNTLKGVYQHVTAAPYAWNTYLPKYGGMGGGSWQTSGGGLIKEPADSGRGATGSGAATTDGGTGRIVGEPLYLLNTGNNAYHTLYNSTAARYCHEKNEDVNGNGEIDPSEAHWYLPSQRELQLFWTYREPLKLNADYYWSSTAADADKAYAVSMIESPAEPHQVHNGVQQPLPKILLPGGNPPRVRCVRRMQANGATGMKPLVKHLVDGSFVIDCSNLPGDMHTSVSKMGIAQSEVGLLQKANSKVFKKFQVQKEQPAAADYSAMHRNGGKCDAQKGWRLPTQREMLLMVSVRPDLEAQGIAPFANNGYWTMTRGTTHLYTVDLADGGVAKYENLIQGASLHYRCIKELY